MGARALKVERFGPPADLRLVEEPTPPVGPDDVRVEVHALGLNFPDVLAVAGSYQTLPPLPFVPGKEAVGTVREVGASVADLAPGDRVMVQLENGAFREELVAPAADCFRLPDGLSTEAAAAMGLAYQTAYFALVDRGGFRAGETVLVTGAAGGVGIAAVQLVRALGGRALAGTSSPEKAAFAMAHGADGTVDLSGDDLREGLRRQVLTATGGRGVDIVIDPVGGAVFEASLRALAWSGRLVVVGFASGPIPTLKANYLLLKNIAVTGLNWAYYRTEQRARIREVQDHIFALHGAGLIDPPIMAALPLERYAEGLELIAGRRVMGKVVLLTGRGGTGG